MALVGAVAKGLGLVDKPKKAAPADTAATDTSDKKRQAQMGAEQAASLRSRRRGYRSLLGRADEGQTGLSDKLGG